MLICLQNFPVDEILSTQTATVNGAMLVQKLHSNVMYTRQERIFVVKHISNYLMATCKMYDSVMLVLLQ